MRGLLLGVIASLGVAGCSTMFMERAGTAMIDDTFQRLQLNWRGGGVTRMAVRAEPVDGDLRVCLGYGTEAGTSWNREFSREYLRRSHLNLQGRRILTGLDFGADNGAEVDLAGLAANCVQTRAAYRPGDEAARLDMEGPRRIVIVE